MRVDMTNIQILSKNQIYVETFYKKCDILIIPDTCKIKGVD